jgi:ubiquinone/menaquinone biosynthesis C-methylase UbiE
MDISGAAHLRSDQTSAKAFLLKHLAIEVADLYGVEDPRYLTHVANEWYNDDKKDFRWKFLENKLSDFGHLQGLKVLDMASGCGTFVFHGLKQGYDVVGVDPDPWKTEFIKMKVRDCHYPDTWIARFIPAFGEALPFDDGAFDLVTTYQTLEHVSDVARCLHEMLRVVKPGGYLYIVAPSYNSFYEGHYRVPFLPRMPRVLAKGYLKALGRPLAGLNSINYVTTSNVKAYLLAENTDMRLVDLKQQEFTNRHGRVRQRLALDAVPHNVSSALNYLYAGWKYASKIGRAEETIQLWVQKEPHRNMTPDPY